MGFNTEIIKLVARNVNALFCTNDKAQSLLLCLSVDRNMHDIEDYFDEQYLDSAASKISSNVSAHFTKNEPTLEVNPFNEWENKNPEAIKSAILRYVSIALDSSKHDIGDKDALYNYHLAAEDIEQLTEPALKQERAKKPSIEEKAKILVDKLVAEDGLDVGATMHRMIEKRIILALKEQDRDTRHACAEAVIGAKDAHAACMNTRAV